MAIKPPQAVALDLSALRIGVYGPSGGGKTHFMMGVPDMTIVNAERSAGAFASRFPHARAINIDTNLGPAETAKDMADAFNAVLDRRRGFEAKALGFDSVTAYRRALERVPDRKKSFSFKDADVNNEMRATFGRLLEGAPIPVILSAHEKRVPDPDKNTFAHHDNMIPDADPRFYYPLDIAVRLFKNGDRHGGVIVKSRFGNLLPLNQFIPNLSYAWLITKLGGTVEAPAAQTGAPQTGAPATRPLAQAGPAQTSTQGEAPAPAHASAPPADGPTEAQMEKRFTALVNRHAASGTPDGTIVRWLKARGYPLSKRALTTDEGLYRKIYYELAPSGAKRAS